MIVTENLMIFGVHGLVHGFFLFDVARSETTADSSPFDMNGRDVPQHPDEDRQTCEDKNDILALGGCFLLWADRLKTNLK